ncbi:hypothetical protein M0813_11575 [Anaeramoeba flamelloides]|uniref:Uncharacterized protein n=1 Tax=Anaeramoeba flamelloides TaxID=1746091 RepID=A0ABQ8ZFA8_9EUKA|nr:hypothetical protein M0813_11575 [Anaeramoeba flamelloides]
MNKAEYETENQRIPFATKKTCKTNKQGNYIRQKLTTASKSKISGGETNINETTNHKAKPITTCPQKRTKPRNK